MNERETSNEGTSQGTRSQTARLLGIMARLRAPGGCPWDRDQTHRTLKPYLLEEAHEFFDALDHGDDAEIADELGDVLLQIVFHCQIAAEEGRFDFEDVARRISDKMERRHPHVFADAQVADADGVVTQWEEIKKAEKGGVTPESILDGMPRSLPALHRAQEIQDRVSRVGFDWTQVEGVLEKIREETDEVAAAIRGRADPHDDAESADRVRADRVRADRVRADRVRAEIGDLLFSVVNLSRFVGESAEDLLHDMVRRFDRRFRRIEEGLAAEGRRAAECTPKELERRWEEAKDAERSGG